MGSKTGGAWVGKGVGMGGDGEGRWSETGGAWVGLGREDGRERDGRCLGGDGAGREGRGWGRRGARREVHGCGRGAADTLVTLVTRTWWHHKHHCRLLRVSLQVERSMGGGSSAPCFAEARSDARGAVLQGLYDGLGCPKGAQCTRQTVKSWPKRQERSTEGADAAPCFLERLSEAMLHWGWRLAAEIENSHLRERERYICIYNTSNFQPD